MEATQNVELAAVAVAGDQQEISETDGSSDGKRAVVTQKKVDAGIVKMTKFQLKAGYKEARAVLRIEEKSRKAELQRTFEEDVRLADERAAMIERRFSEAEAALADQWKYEEVRKKYDKVQRKEDERMRRASLKDEIVEDRRLLRIKYQQEKGKKDEGLQEESELYMSQLSEAVEVMTQQQGQPPGMDFPSGDLVRRGRRKCKLL